VPRRVFCPLIPGKAYKVAWLAAVASALPLFIMWPKFRTLFWFQDDWALLDSLSSQGFFHWVVQPFDGILAPVFKAVWYVSVHGSCGAYIGMICTLWLLHAANTGLLAISLRRIGLPWAGAFLAALTFGIPWSNIETLGWAAQLFQVTSLALFLLAFNCMMDFVENNHHLILSAGFALGSALCFPRGMLSGCLILFWFMLAERRAGRRLWAPAFLFLAPEFAVWAFHYLRALHFPGAPGANLILIAKFAISYLILNPLYVLFSYHGKGLSLSAFLIFGSAKIAVIVFALAVSDRKIQNLLWTLLAFDVGNAILLGAGRYWTGLAATVSSRYQYVSLLCFAPFIAAAAVYVARRYPAARFRTLWVCLIVACWMVVLIAPWPRKVNQWIQWRGYGPRAQAAGTAPAQGVALCGYSANRIQELMREFHLH
jgi:hypothetical protein